MMQSKDWLAYEFKSLNFVIKIDFTTYCTETSQTFIINECLYWIESKDADIDSEVKFETIQ